MTPEEILERLVVAIERIADALEGDDDGADRPGPLQRITVALERIDETLEEANGAS